MGNQVPDLRKRQKRVLLPETRTAKKPAGTDLQDKGTTRKNKESYSSNYKIRVRRTPLNGHPPSLQLLPKNKRDRRFQ